MTRDEAETLRERLAREQPESTWVARRAGDEWEVVKVRLPGAPGARRGPLTATTEAAERPPQGDDPRPSGWRDVPPYGAGI